MARDHARLLVTIWRDDDFTALPALAQRMFMLVLSQPRLSYCGGIDYTPARWASLAADTTTEDVEQAVAELEAARIVVVDHDSAELVIRTFVRHDGVCDSPNLTQAMWKAWGALFSRKLRAAVVAELPDSAFTAGFGSDKPKGGYEPPQEALTMRPGNPSPDPSPSPPPAPRKPLPNPSTNPSSTPSPSPSPSPSPPPRGSTKPSRTTKTRSRATAADEEDRLRQEQPPGANPDPRIPEAFTELAKLKLVQRRQSPGPPILDERRWLAEVALRDQAEHRDTALRHLANRPTLTSYQLAQILNGQTRILELVPRASTA